MVEPGPGKPPATRRERARVVAVVGLSAVGVLFAVLNFDEVKVNWLFGTWSTPLIIVIALSMVIGAGLGYLAARRRSGGKAPDAR